MVVTGGRGGGRTQPQHPLGAWRIMKARRHPSGLRRAQCRSPGDCGKSAPGLDSTKAPRGRFARAPTSPGGRSWLGARSPTNEHGAQRQHGRPDSRQQEHSFVKTAGCSNP